MMNGYRPVVSLYCLPSDSYAVTKINSREPIRLTGSGASDPIPHLSWKERVDLLSKTSDAFKPFKSFKTFVMTYLFHSLNVPRGFNQSVARVKRSNGLLCLVLIQSKRPHS